jgi:MFS family permease
LSLARLLPAGYRGLPASLWILIGVVFLSFVGLGVILPVRILYAQQVGMSLAEIGVMGAAFFISQLFFQVPIGLLTDRIGRKWTLLGGLLIQGLAAWVYLLTDLGWVFILMRFVEGIGASSQQPAARAYIADVVPERQRGRAYGLYRAAFQGGLLAGPAIGGLLAGFGGYEVAYSVNGISRRSSFALVLFFVHEPRRAPRLATAGRQAGQAGEGGARALFSRPLLASYVVGLGALAANGIDASIWSIFMVDLGATMTVVGLSYTARALAAVLVTPFGGALADRYSRPLLVCVSGAIWAATGFFLAFIRNPWIIVGITLAQGLALALMLPALDRYLADHSPVWARARVQSIFQAVQAGAAALVSLAAAPLYQLGPTYPFLGLAIMILLTVVGGSLLMATVTRPVPRRQSRSQPAEG